MLTAAIATVAVLIFPWVFSLYHKEYFQSRGKGCCFVLRWILHGFHELHRKCDHLSGGWISSTWRGSQGALSRDHHTHNRHSMKATQSQQHLEPNVRGSHFKCTWQRQPARGPVSDWWREKGHLVKPSPEQLVHFWPLCRILKTYLHQIDQVQEKLLGILLSVRGEFWVALADKGLEHAWRDPILLRLEYKDKIIAYRWKPTTIILLKGTQ